MNDFFSDVPDDYQPANILEISSSSSQDADIYDFDENNDNTNSKRR